MTWQEWPAYHGNRASYRQSRGNWRQSDPRAAWPKAGRQRAKDDSILSDKSIAVLAERIAKYTATGQSTAQTPSGRATTTATMSTPGTDPTPKIMNHKGALVEVSWICSSCTQPHWGNGLKCVCCFKARDAKGTTAPLHRAGATTSPSPKLKLQGPLANKANLKLLQKIGFFKDREVTSDDGAPKDESAPGAADRPDEECPRQKAFGILEWLKGSGAAESVIRSAQAQVDAHPIPKPTQAIRMGAGAQQILAKHLEAREARRAEQQRAIDDLKAQRDDLDKVIDEQEKQYAAEEEQAERDTAEIKLAIAKAETMATDPGERQEPPPIQETTADVVQKTLSAQLQKMESDPRFAGYLDAIRAAFSETVTLAASNPQQVAGAGPAPAAAQAAAAAKAKAKAKASAARVAPPPAPEDEMKDD